MIKVGVTGSTGVLGRLLVSKLLLDNNISVSCFEGDICNKKDISKWLADNRDIKKIIHLAALVATKDVEKNPINAYEVNVGGTINLLSVITKLDLKIWFFYASTCHVYKSKNSAIREDDNIEPISLYGKTKYAAEQICHNLLKDSSSNIKICCGRIFSFFHETQKIPFLYPSILYRLKSEDLSKPFFLYGADSIRDFLNAEEIIEILIKFIDKEPKGIINIASGKGVRIRDFVESISDKTLNIITNDKDDVLVANVNKLKIIINE